jgi:translation initiation factor IF-3
LEVHLISKRKYYQLNDRIKSPTVRVIKDGENLGEMGTKSAVSMAREQGLDVVVIAENTNPPVAKILDFNKFLYEERKKQSKSKTKSKKSQLKEFRLSPKIGEGDLTNKAERTKEFIKEGNQVRITVRMRGRERAHPEVALEQIEKFRIKVEEVAKLEKEPQMKGHSVTAIFVKK